VTLGGRIVGAVVMVVGITTYGMVTAALATPSPGLP
jgi:voltage-gated potassium channel